MDKKIKLIGDDRLVGYVNRIRSGNIQIFHTGCDERDFDRYKKDGGGKKANVTMHDKPDTIRISPPEKHYYSKLIDGEWWWVNGCDECNGKERSGHCYVECESHNVCAVCRKPRSEFKGSVWGGMNGWICDPCQKKEHEIEKERALAAMPDEDDYDEWEYYNNDEIKCPHCAYEFSDSFEFADADDQAFECPRCDNSFTVTAQHSLTFDSSK